MTHSENNQIEILKTEDQKYLGFPQIYPNEIKNLSSTPITIEKVIRNLNLHTQYAIEVGTKGKIKWVTDYWAPNIKKLVQDVYDNYITHKTGNLYPFREKKHPATTIRTFYTNFTNNTPNNQIALSQTYKESVKNITSFSTTIKEKVVGSISFKFSWAGGNGGIGGELEMNTEEKKQTTTEKIEEVDYPSQAIKALPNAKNRLEYAIKKRIVHCTGMVQYIVKLDDRIGAYLYLPLGGRPVSSNGFTIKQVIEILYKMGHGKIIDEKSNRFAVIKTDNPKNPTRATLNIPIRWTRQDPWSSIYLTNLTD